MPPLLHSLAQVRLDRFIPCIAFIQTLVIIIMSFRIYHKLDEALSSGIKPKLPSGTLSALNNSNLPKLAFNGRWLSAPGLPRGMNIREEKEYLDLLHALQRLLTEAGVEYIMCDGTLLGSFMSHGFLPWDDDADIMVNIKDIDKVNKIYTSKDIQKIYGTMTYHDDILDDIGDYTQYTDNPMEYEDKSLMDTSYQFYPNIRIPVLGTKQQHKAPQVYIPAYKTFHKFKFFRLQSQTAGKSAWRWPYIDIKYYTNNGSHITNIDFYTEIFHVPTQFFYPLTMRPFGTLWLPAPKNTRAYLRAKYKSFTCRSSPWNHKFERKRQIKAVTCKKLTKFYPFVWRYRFDGGVLETLKMGHHVLHTLALGDTFRGRYGPFTL